MRPPRQKKSRFSVPWLHQWLDDYMPEGLVQPHGGNMPAIWSVAEDDLLRELRGVQGLTTKAVARRLGRTEGVTARRFRDLGIRSPGPQAKPVVRHYDYPRPAPPLVNPRHTLPLLPSLEMELYVMQGH